MSNDDLLFLCLVLGLFVAFGALAWGGLRGASAVAGAVLRAQEAPDPAPLRWVVVAHWLGVAVVLGATAFGVYVAPLHTIAACAVVAVFLLHRRLGRKQV